MNQITHFHDSSNVYGSDEEDSATLRAGKGGLLKVHTEDTRSLLPQDEVKEECEIPDPLQEAENKKCFEAGQ